MKKIVKKGTLFILILVFMLQTVNGNELNEKLYYYVFVDNKTSVKYRGFNFENSDNTSKKIFKLLTALINDKDIICIPENTKLLDVKVINKIVYLNFNEDILNYQGSLYEVIMLNQIFQNTLQFQEVDMVTILVENKVVDFKEGNSTTFIDSLNGVYWN